MHCSSVIPLRIARRIPALSDTSELLCKSLAATCDVVNLHLLTPCHPTLKRLRKLGQMPHRVERNLSVHPPALDLQSEKLKRIVAHLGYSFGCLALDLGSGPTVHNAHRAAFDSGPLAALSSSMNCGCALCHEGCLSR